MQNGKWKMQKCKMQHAKCTCERRISAVPTQRLRLESLSLSRCLPDPAFLCLAFLNSKLDWLFCILCIVRACPGMCVCVYVFSFSWDRIHMPGRCCVEVGPVTSPVATTTAAAEAILQPATTRHAKALIAPIGYAILSVPNAKYRMPNAKMHKFTNANAQMLLPKPMSMPMRVRVVQVEGCVDCGGNDCSSWSSYIGDGYCDDGLT